MNGSVQDRKLTLFHIFRQLRLSLSSTLKERPHLGDATAVPVRYFCPFEMRRVHKSEALGWSFR